MSPSIRNNTHSGWGRCWSNWLKNFIHLLYSNQQCGSRLLWTRRHITSWSSFNETLTHLNKQWCLCNIEWDEVEVEKECNGKVHLFSHLLFENLVHWTTWRCLFLAGYVSPLLGGNGGRMLEGFLKNGRGSSSFFLLAATTFPKPSWSSFLIPFLWITLTPLHEEIPQLGRPNKWALNSVVCALEIILAKIAILRHIASPT